MDTTTTTDPVASTITHIAIGSVRTGRPVADRRYERCWCGQDMDVTHGTHCPRCGSGRVASHELRVAALLPRLAA